MRIALRKLRGLGPEIMDRRYVGGAGADCLGGAALDDGDIEELEAWELSRREGKEVEKA